MSIIIDLYMLAIVAVFFGVPWFVVNGGNRNG